MTSFFIFFIRLYQKYISPLLGNNCRFYPSCSEYMRRSIENCGIIRGFAYGIWRILKCNPWSAGGIDEPHSCK
mgnify:CR=1 FL=1